MALPGNTIRNYSAGTAATAFSSRGSGADKDAGARLSPNRNAATMQ